MFAMSCFHVGSFIVVWSTCHQSDKFNLLLSLFGHVGLCKIARYPLILEHNFIKLLDNKRDSWLFSKPLV
jgi:hypothetical protein